MYRPPIRVAHTSRSSRSSLISTAPSTMTNEKGGRSSSTQSDTRGSRRIERPFSDSAPVVKTIVPSSSRSYQMGATWGLPSFLVVASFPVRAGAAVRKALHSSRPCKGPASGNTEASGRASTFGV